MKYELFSIYDEIIQTYNLPFHSINKNDAMRQLRFACETPNSPLNKSPQDYSLYFVGIYDDQTGSYISIEPKELICRCSQLVINQSINLEETNNENN